MSAIARVSRSSSDVAIEAEPLEIANDAVRTVSGVDALAASSFESTPSSTPPVQLDGAPSSPATQPRVEDTALVVPNSEKLAVLKQVVDAATASELNRLFDTSPGLDPVSLDAAYAQVLAARRSPGEHSFDFEVIPLEEQVVGVGEGTQLMITSKPPLRFHAQATVDTEGRVNGTTLEVDRWAALSVELGSLHPELKSKALLAAGLSADWVSVAPPERIDTALAMLRRASEVPGPHTLDLSYSSTRYTGGESGYEETVQHDGRLSFDVAADGTIGGRVPNIEVALATQRTMAALSSSDRRTMLEQLQLPAEVVEGLDSSEAASLLTRISMATLEPGSQRLDFSVRGRDWQLGLEIGPEGQILGAGASPIPPDPPWWKQILGPVLTIVSIAFPVAAPFCQIAQAALAISNGVKGLGLVAAIAGAGAGISGIGDLAAGAASASLSTQMLTNVAATASATDGVLRAARDGDPLSLLSSAASLASAGSALAGAPLDTSFEPLQLAGRAAGVAAMVRDGDLGGLFSTAVSELAAKDQGRVDDQVIARLEETIAPEVFLAPSMQIDPDLVVTDVSPAWLDPSVPAFELAPQSNTHVVRAGETLSQIAADRLGDAGRWPELYDVNRKQLGSNPNAIRAGVELQLPPDDLRLPAAERRALFAQAVMPARAAETNLFDLSVDVPFDSEAFLANSGGDRTATIGTSSPTRPRGMLETMGNATINSVRMTGALVADAAEMVGHLAEAVVPGTEANRTFQYVLREELGPWISERVSNRGAASDLQGALERAVQRTVGTAMDPRRWGPALDAAVDMVFGGLRPLSDALGSEPEQVSRETLVQLGNNAIQGLTLLAGAKVTGQLLLDGSLAAAGVPLRSSVLVGAGVGVTATEASASVSSTPVRQAGEVQQALTADDLIRTRALVYENYAAKGYLNPDPLEARRAGTFHLNGTHASPAARRSGEVFFVEDTQGQVAATATLIRERAGANLLPLDASASEPMSALRASLPDATFAELGGLAASSTSSNANLLRALRGTEATPLTSLFEGMLAHAERQGVTELVIGVHPTHAAFYSRALGFTVQPAARSTYAGLQNAEVVVLHARPEAVRQALAARAAGVARGN